jgi:hypothetical protein
MEKRMNGEWELILQRLQSIEEKLEQLSKKPSHQHIQIQQMTVYDPYLENLTYQLDRINVKELSGSLNIGNNFEMVTTKEKDKMKKDPVYQAKKQQEPKRKNTNSVQSEQVDNQIEIASLSQDKEKEPSHERKIEQTVLGYRVKIENKKRRG